VKLNKRVVEEGTPVEITYTFTTDAHFAGLRKDYLIFVRFRDSQGTIRFVDDHTPAVLTNQWTPSQTYTYTRSVFVPENIPAGTYVIELGMYQTSGRGELMQLNAPKRGDRAYDLGRIQIALPSSKAEYVSGWYDPESEPQERWYHWRWMGKSAVL